jgi:DNA polymerase III sliding clamp (beta) subunit (PCNA family)
MKVTVRINEFKRILEEATCVIPKKPEIPILKFVKIDVHGMHATLSAKDVDYGHASRGSAIQAFELVDSSADGSFLLDPKKMQHFLKGHKDGWATIEVTSDSKQAIVKAGAFTMNSANPSYISEFPQLSPMPAVSNQVSLKFLKRLIEQVQSACPDREQEVATACVKLESDGIRLRAIATDGYRLSIAEALGNFGVFSLLVPKTFLPLLDRRQGTIVRIATSKVSHFFQTDTVLLECDKPTAKFPPWERALKLTDWKCTVRVSSAELKSVLSSVLSTINEKKPAIVLIVRGEDLQVSTAQTDEITTGTLRVMSTEGDQAAKIKINPEFLMDFLSQAAGEITLQFKDEKSFFRLSKDGGNYQCFVMPLQWETKPKPVSQCDVVSTPSIS